MPKIANLLGYSIFFWSNENDEPCHVHVCKGNPQSNATKIWIRQIPVLAHNKSDIPQKDLSRILNWLTVNREKILQKWIETFSN